MRRRPRALLVMAALLPAACSHLPVPPQPLPVLAGSEVVLLGEVHDNASGHARRLAVLRQSVEAGWRPAIALEQFDRERQAALTQAQQDCGSDTRCLIRAGGGEGVDWQWRLYQPVLELAQRYRLPLLAANLSRADAGRLVREGVQALPASDARLRELLATIPPDLQRGQEEAVATGHCRQLPETLLPAMARAQIARDVVMAETILPYRQRGVVLLAGNGHVRSDIGVPRWLSGSRSIGFLEAPVLPADGRYDQIVTIPAVSRDDPCAGVIR